MKTTAETKAKAMRRINNLFEQICSIDNLNAADINARKGKAKQRGVQQHIINQDKNIQDLHVSLITKSFTTSPYKKFKIYDPKERDIFCLPYSDRIVHHAIMNVLEPIFVKLFTADTYSCIRGRGIHAASFALRKALKDAGNTTYCLKLDIKKFYPSVNHDILKSLLRKKFKDNDLLWLLDNIIDSAEGLPIGNYISQYLANFYLTYFDHWLKENKAVKYYFRYADDMVILSSDKAYLHSLLADIKNYLSNELHLTVKDNYQIFPVYSRGIDFVGYVHYHSHTLLRKTIKKRFARKLSKGCSDLSIASYMGWAKHCNSKNLINKLLNQKIA